MNPPLLISFYVFFPLVVLFLCQRIPLLGKIGPIIICYAIGAAVGNSGLLSSDIYTYQEMTANVTIALSLPLLLFSVDIQRWTRLAGKTILSFSLATISVSIVSFLGYVFIKNRLTEAWKIAGMVIGVYTGGTPNLAAIKAALNVDANTYLMVHTYDTAISIIYLLFVITVAQRVFNRFLPRFVFNKKNMNERTRDDHLAIEDIGLYKGMLNAKKLLPLTAAFLLSSVIALIGFLFSRIVADEYSTSIAVLSITTLGIGCSLFPSIRNIDKTYQLGMYIIYIFCLVVGSMATVTAVIKIDYSILLYIICMIFVTMLLHALLARIFNVDTHTFLITSTAAICSPPFVPIVTGALRNREILFSGLTTGIIGYAIGNYLGIFLAYLYRSLF